MNTFLVERTIPVAFHVDDPEQVALHARWAVDAYREVGAFWIGGLVTEDRMWSLVTAEQAHDLDRYARALGIADQAVTVRRVVRPLGPYFAAPQGSVRPPGGPR
jgi:hypothetical protein